MKEHAMHDTLLTELVTAVARKLRILPDKPEENAEVTVRALWLKAAGSPVSAERARCAQLPALSAQSRDFLHNLIHQRLQGIPLAHLTGRQQFMNTELLVHPGALIPRKETELLGFTALNILDDIRRRVEGPPRVIDLCTGSGNLACALAVHGADLRVVGADISTSAIACARDNRRFLGLDERIDFVAADMLNSFVPRVCRERVAMIVCNPPYISNASLGSLPVEIIGHEPREAFDGGPMGVSILNRLVKDGVDYIADGGWICCETGRGQGDWLAKRFSRNREIRQVQTRCDADGSIRVVAAQRGTPAG
jgi:release factor glutamine methyltransferase